MLDKRWNFNENKFDLSKNKVYNNTNVNICLTKGGVSKMTELYNLLLQKPTDFLGVRLTKTEKDLIKKEAEKENLTYTNLVRKIIVEYFSDKEEHKNK